MSCQKLFPILATSALGVFLWASSGCSGGSSPAAVPPLAPLPVVKEAPSYTLIKGRGPVVILLATDMNDTLYNVVTGGENVWLIESGYSVLSMDLPCHGANNAMPGVDPLNCWAWYLEKGDKTLFTEFCAGLSAVLDELHETDVSIMGVSRGAYVAVTCAAYDDRIKNLVLISPLTDLNYLYEFAPSHEVNEQEFGIGQFEPYIKDRPILVRVGARDTRIGTSLAVIFALEVGATLQVLDTIGHSAPEDGSSIKWLESQGFTP